MERKKIYNYFVIAVIMIITAVLFFMEYRNISVLFSGGNGLSFLALSVTVVLVHGIKAARLYLILYGSEITPDVYLKTYCMVSPVSVVVPFKLGEFFRIYCYGRQIGDLLKGAVIILLDRFMDTGALVTVIMLVWIFYGGGDTTALAYILLFFMIIVMLLYFVFPGVSRFWKQYLLRARASRNRLRILKILEAFNTVYEEIDGVTKGRGTILYVMSLAAWAVEIGSLALADRADGNGKLGSVVSGYLSSAMGDGQSVQLRQFVFVSVTVLILARIMMWIRELFSGKKEKG